MSSHDEPVYDDVRNPVLDESYKSLMKQTDQHATSNNEEGTKNEYQAPPFSRRRVSSDLEEQNVVGIDGSPTGVEGKNRTILDPAALNCLYSRNNSQSGVELQ